jgi:hypothetical protein
VLRRPRKTLRQAKPGSLRFVAAVLGMGKSTVGRWMLRSRLELAKQQLKQEEDAAAAAAAGKSPPSVPIRKSPLLPVAGRGAASSASAGSANGHRKERRGGSNILVTSQLAGLVQFAVLERHANDCATDIHDVSALTEGFREVLRHQAALDKAADDDMLAASVLDSMGSARSSASSASAAGANAPLRALGNAAASELVDAEQHVPALKPLSLRTLQRMLKDLRLSLQTAQARKPSRQRLTIEAETNTARADLNRYPRHRIWVVDETGLQHARPPSQSYAPVGCGGAHVAGESRGAATTAVLCVSVYVLLCQRCLGARLT